MPLTELGSWGPGVGRKQGSAVGVGSRPSSTGLSAAGGRSLGLSV